LSLILAHSLGTANCSKDAVFLHCLRDRSSLQELHIAAQILPLLLRKVMQEEMDAPSP